MLGCSGAPGWPGLMRCMTEMNILGNRVNHVMVMQCVMHGDRE